MRKNSIYHGNDVGIYTVEIKDNLGAVIHSRSFDDYSNAMPWAKGMTNKKENFSYNLLDSETKTILESGKFSQGEFSEGAHQELEHRDLIVKMLIEAGKEPTEEKILAIAEEIARVHYEEDPEYYSKLEKVGL